MSTDEPLLSPPRETRDVIPESHHDIFEKESFAHFATVMPDGTPHVTPVWVDHENGKYALLNSARGRQKVRNVERNPRVGVSVTDPDDPYRYVSVRGEAELIDEGAVAHIDKLAQKYMDVEEYPHHGEESGARVIVRIPADTVVTNG
ncbi:PPOX class probable F420-dependent enzyme [Halogeometricum rufum]|uniref:PPOX class probable F420-dependent enzyme n=1 Tax=Halogeometricum rufum TaxID=553469 RepID=A0A1I6GER1_9EURY|nr:PPOX class probable F420-dependent enzyme [Halogeometricum rufum]